MNGQPVAESEVRLINGYLHLERTWNADDIVDLVLPMKVSPMKGNPEIRETVGMVAIQRGPMVYCLEEADNGKGLHKLIIHPGFEEQVHFDSSLLGGLLTIDLTAYRIQDEGWRDQLYRVKDEDHLVATTARFIPYFAWANRGSGEMRVWIRENTVLPS